MATAASSTVVALFCMDDLRHTTGATRTICWAEEDLSGAVVANEADASRWGRLQGDQSRSAQAALNIVI